MVVCTGCRIRTRGKCCIPLEFRHCVGQGSCDSLCINRGDDGDDDGGALSFRLRSNSALVTRRGRHSRGIAGSFDSLSMWQAFCGGAALMQLSRHLPLLHVFAYQSSLWLRPGPNESVVFSNCFRKKMQKNATQ